MSNTLVNSPANDVGLPTKVRWSLVLFLNFELTFASASSWPTTHSAGAGAFTIYKSKVD